MKAAFTLIELLVVVSIIAVLASMLLPAINAVRMSAFKAKCGSNMRQLGMVECTYANEHEGLITPSFVTSAAVPASWVYAPGTYFMYWGAPLLGQYVDGFESSVNESLTGPQLKSIFKCPRDLRRVGNREWETSIGLNTSIAPQVSGLPTDKWDSNMANISRISDTVLFMDGSNARLSLTSWAGYPMGNVQSLLVGGFNTNPVPWHGGNGANMLFVDGHVRFSTNPTAEFLTGVTLTK